MPHAHLAPLHSRARFPRVPWKDLRTSLHRYLATVHGHLVVPHNDGNIACSVQNVARNVCFIGYGDYDC